MDPILNLNNYLQVSSSHNRSCIGQSTVQGRVTRFTGSTFFTEQNNHILETLYVSIKMSNFQVKKTYETARGTALAHRRLHFLGLIKCFGLLPTLVLRYFGFRCKMKSSPIFTYTTALTLTQPLLVYKIF